MLRWLLKAVGWGLQLGGMSAGNKAAAIGLAVAGVQIKAHAEGMATWLCAGRDQGTIP